MVTLANELSTNQTSHDQFVLSLRELLESLREIQELLGASKAHEKDKKQDDMSLRMVQNPSYGVHRTLRESPLPPATSTPISGPAVTKATYDQLSTHLPSVDHVGMKRMRPEIERERGSVEHPMPKPRYIGSVGVAARRREVGRRRVLPMSPSRGVQVSIPVE